MRLHYGGWLSIAQQLNEGHRIGIMCVVLFLLSLASVCLSHIAPPPLPLSPAATEHQYFVEGPKGLLLPPSGRIVHYSCNSKVLERASNILII